jgi:hypothetical protein
MQSVPDTGAATALELAKIRPERQGHRRLNGLTPPERKLYRWILQRFAAAVPPSGEATRATALELGLDPDDRLSLRWLATISSTQTATAVRSSRIRSRHGTEATAS